MTKPVVTLGTRSPVEGESAEGAGTLTGPATTTRDETGLRCGALSLTPMGCYLCL